MNFKHKLSARLARLKDLVVFAALAATACERPVLTGSGDAVTRLVVFPRNLTVHPSDTAQLMAVAFTSSGDTGSISVNWSVTGGSIIGTSTSGGRHYGRFQAASQPGKVDVIAEAAVAAPLADTAVVAVTPVPVASVAVAPAVMSMLVGATAQLAAVTLDSAGSILSGRTVTWGSSAPTVAFVNSVGLVTAAAAGSATITATSEGQTGSSAVTVTNVSAPVASVTVTPGSASIQSGQRLQLTGQRAGRPRDHLGEQQCDSCRRRRQRPCDRGCGRVGDDHGDERRAEWLVVDHGHQRACARSVGDGRAPIGRRTSRSDGAVDGHAEGRERQPVDRPDGGVEQLQHGRGGGDRHRARYGRGGWIRDRHGDE